MIKCRLLNWFTLKYSKEFIRKFLNLLIYFFRNNLTKPNLNLKNNMNPKTKVLIIPVMIWFSKIPPNQIKSRKINPAFSRSEAKGTLTSKELSEASALWDSILKAIKVFAHLFGNAYMANSLTYFLIF